MAQRPGLRSAGNAKRVLIDLEASPAQSCELPEDPGCTVVGEGQVKQGAHRVKSHCGGSWKAPSPCKEPAAPRAGGGGKARAALGGRGSWSSQCLSRKLLQRT